MKPQIYVVILFSFSIIALALYFTFKPLSRKIYIKDLAPAEMTMLHHADVRSLNLLGDESIITLLDSFISKCNDVAYVETKALPDIHLVFENHERIVSYLIYQIDESNFQMHINQQIKDSISSGFGALSYECNQKLLLNELPSEIMWNDSR